MRCPQGPGSAQSLHTCVRAPCHNGWHQSAHTPSTAQGAYDELSEQPRAHCPCCRRRSRQDGRSFRRRAGRGGARRHKGRGVEGRRSTRRDPGGICPGVWRDVCPGVQLGGRREIGRRKIGPSKGSARARILFFKAHAALGARQRCRRPRKTGAS
ncbi:hypothetical protein COLSTE_00908 [Collinsella stercoris DSM 13279]|uniref:Uncharacterized protein n=1 Tax=Collinsella stercoris DSM 13279 TaxID=445975 RepID=B6GA17_9ACTN|nr:hypothetical protein COLSTE_00908 [Collinsella stercoris DSM 13279]